MQQLVIITGLSGSGKTIVLRSLEDMEYYCVDNLPVNMLPDFADHINEDVAFYPKVAVGIDIRSQHQDLIGFPETVKQLKKQLHVRVVFLSAAEKTLLSRYSETRRRHPLSTAQQKHSLTEAIRLEAQLMAPVKETADLIIDTSQLKVQQLKQQIWQIMNQSNQRVTVIIKSFAFKRGVPFDADFVFDARCLPNPYWEKDLRPYTGQDEPIIEFFKQEPLVAEYLTDLCLFSNKWIDKFEVNDRSYITVAIGCTGGRHRSVYLAEALHTYLAGKNINNMLLHRELGPSD
ncbi:MAG: RNase adapter RapZ [Proteobacteria bacterium]|nr:MAG: RNase adapter RapZ [Pseudomonadota bacterium]